jgi:hypothetical protein
MSQEKTKRNPLKMAQDQTIGNLGFYFNKKKRQTPPHKEWLGLAGQLILRILLPLLFSDRYYYNNLQYPYSYQNNITEHYKMIPVY